VLSDFRAFVRKIHAELPETRVLFIAIKPSVARWHLADRIREANQLVESFTRGDDRLGYIDVFTPMLGPDGRPRAELLVGDGLHLNDEGYKLWTSLVRPHLAAAPSGNDDD
jgi:lysophospholipase L1-like esterase